METLVYKKFVLFEITKPVKHKLNINILHIIQMVKLVTFLMFIISRKEVQ